MKKLERKPHQLESEFDVVKQNRYYDTLQTNDIIRLMEAYGKTELPQEKQKKIVEKFLEVLVVEALNNPIFVAPNDLFCLQVIETKGDKIKKVKETKGWKGNTIKYEVLDKDKMWQNLVKNSGYNWELVGEMNKNYDFYNVNFSEEAQELAMDKGRNGGKFLQAKIQWQIA